jgi:myo-inositol catabolism protein IolH
MVKIALDPAMYHAELSVVEEIRKAADLGYEHLELSPRPDWFFWHRYPKADDDLVAGATKACSETGVAMTTLVPVFNWSAPDEQERQAQVRNWRRLLEIADGLDCRTIVSELSGDPNRPLQSEHAFYKSMEELIPHFERFGIALNLEAHPYDFSERNDDAVQIIRGINKPWVNYVFCSPHAFHLSEGKGDVRRMLQYAGGKLKHLHIADCYNHLANVGNRYIVNPPGVDPRPPAQRDRQRRPRLGRVLLHRERPTLRRHRDRLRVRLGGNRRRHPPPDAGAGEGRAQLIAPS